PGNHRLKGFAAPRLECGDGAGFVQLHQSAVADHIGGQDCGETALGALFGHVAPLLPACAQIRLYWRHAGESMAPGFWNGSRREVTEVDVRVGFWLNSGFGLRGTGRQPVPKYSSLRSASTGTVWFGRTAN